MGEISPKNGKLKRHLLALRKTPGIANVSSPCLEIEIVYANNSKSSMLQ